jgi:hypothetical protein
MHKRDFSETTLWNEKWFVLQIRRGFILYVHRHKLGNQYLVCCTEDPCIISTLNRLKRHLNAIFL